MFIESEIVKPQEEIRGEGLDFEELESQLKLT